MADQRVDFAIIGAGAAGTYSAWRLRTDPKTKDASVAVFDSLKLDGKPRIGGRLWSVRMPGLGGVRCAELGGMRFLSSQTIVANLTGHLKMKVVPFDVDSRSTLFNLRDTLLRGVEIFDSAKVPYKLQPQEAGQSPGGLLVWAIQNLVPNAPYLSAGDWARVQRHFKIDGDHLWRLGFWNLLQNVLSQEGFSYVSDGQGYDTIVSNWNAADALQWVLTDFYPGVSYMYVHEGYQRLPETLLSQAVEAGAEFYPWRLASWQFGGEGEVELALEDDRGEPRTVRARHLIMAAPRRSLELIKMPDNPSLRSLIGTVAPQPMFKLFVGYEYPWWRSLGLSLGRTITDLPLRQIYYWGSNYSRFYQDAPPETLGVPNAPEHSLLMSYLDGRDVSFWQGLFDPNLTDAKGVYQPFAVDELSGELDERRRMVVQVIQDNLRASHCVNYIPAPYTMAYADWTVDPFGGAYNLWKPGYRSWEVSEQIRAPYEDKPVYICGEAYSLKQGWVEGAFETAETMLEKNLGLAKPDWLPKDYLE